MHAKNILANLLPYQSLLKRLVAHEQAHMNAIPAFTRPTTRLRLQYDFITLNLGYLSEEDGPHRPIANLYGEIRLKLNGTTAAIERVYCEDKTRTDALAELVNAHIAAPRSAWNPALETPIYHSEVVTKYLTIADRSPARPATTSAVMTTVQGTTARFPPTKTPSCSARSTT